MAAISFDFWSVSWSGTWIAAAMVRSCSRLFSWSLALLVM